jgi:hypothetical protein
MVNELLAPIESALYGIFGDYIFLALIIIILFVVLLVWRGLDFRYCLMLLAPCIARIAQSGWLPAWVEGMLWFFVVGFGLYLGWKAIAPSF